MASDIQIHPQNEPVSKLLRLQKDFFASSLNHENGVVDTKVNTIVTSGMLSLPQYRYIPHDHLGMLVPVTTHPQKSSLAFAISPKLPRPTAKPRRRPRSAPPQILFSVVPPRSTQPCQSTFLLQAQRQNESPAPFWTAAGIEAMAAILACALCHISHLPILGSNFTINPKALVNAAGAAIPFSLAFWALEKAPTGITAATETRFRQFFHRRAVWEVAIFCICVALGEELLFRAWLLAGLMGWGFAPPHAVMVSALVFGVLHAYTRIYMLLASIAGLLFGTMFLFTGSVLDPLVVHFLYDFCTILLMQRRWVLKGQ